MCVQRGCVWVVECTSVSNISSWAWVRGAHRVLCSHICVSTWALVFVHACAGDSECAWVCRRISVTECICTSVDVGRVHVHGEYVGEFGHVPISQCVCTGMWTYVC